MDQGPPNTDPRGDDAIASRPKISNSNPIKGFVPAQIRCILLIGLLYILHILKTDLFISYLKLKNVVTSSYPSLGFYTERENDSGHVVVIQARV